MFLSLAVFLILLLTTAFLLYFHLTRNFNYWKERNVPFLKPFLFFGNALKLCTFQQSIGQFMGQLYKSSDSPYVGFFVFDQPFLLIRDPELIKLFLVKDFENFNDRSVMENRRDDEMGSNILFIIKNPAWRELRKKLSPVFSTGKLRHMVPLMIEAGNDMINYLETIGIKQKSIDARDLCMKYTTDVITSCAFGIHANSFKYENAEFRNVSKRVFDWNFSRAIQMASYFFAPMLVKMFRMTFLDPPSAKFMREAFWKTLNEREASGANRGDLIDILIQIRKLPDENCLLDGDKLVAQAAMFFIAGYESSGSTISFSLYEMSVQPAIQGRLRAEIKSILEKHGQISYEVLQEMTYLDMVVSETLRKYPVLPYLDRRCTKPYKIPGTDLVIEEGLPVYFSLMGLHSDPKYFPEPEKYDPERFSVENKKLRPYCCYMPFGEGLHNCIGARFGLMSSKIGIIRILTNYEIELSEDTEVPLMLETKGVLVAPKNTLKLRFKPLKERLVGKNHVKNVD